MDKTYVCILDVYLEEKYSDKGTYYLIEDKQLADLIVRVRQLEFEKDAANRRNVQIQKRLATKLDRATKKAHTYKIELGRCVRKLTRIYKRLFDYHFCDYGDIERAKNYVEDWRKNV